MASLSITNTFTANTLARASEVNTNFTDVSDYINDRNSATLAWDQLKTSGVVTITSTSNQLVLGGANTVTISATTPAASRVITIPDVLANADVILSEGAQTLNGTKTVTALTATLASNLVANSFKLTGLAAGTTAGDSVRYEDVDRIADTQTITGTKTFSAQTVHTAGLQTGSTIVSDTDNTDDLGTSAISFKDLYLKGDVKVGSTTAIDLAASGAVSIRGTNTNDSAAAGFVGEVVESSVGSSTNVPATGVRGDLTSISLSAGDWIVSGHVYFILNGATSTAVEAAISNTAGDSTADTTFGVTRLDGAPPTGNHGSVIPIVERRVQLSGSATYYLKYLAIYSAGTPQARGHIIATRIR